MLKWGGSALYLFILTVFFTFSYVGCVQEEIGPQASLDEDVVLAKKGDVDDFYKDGTTSTCKCFMSVTGTSNMEGFAWGLEDNTQPSGPGQFALVGYANSWRRISDPIYQPFPSSFIALDPEDSGCHSFLFSVFSGGDAPSNATLYTTVQCYTLENGLLNLATTTYHQFIVSEGVPDAADLPGGDAYVWFWRNFSCMPLTAGEEDCTAVK